MAKIVIHAGDIAPGTGAVSFGVIMTPPEKLWQQYGERILPTQLAQIEMANEDAVRRIGGTVGWGAVGGALLGPVGLLAGLLVGGRGKDVTFICRLKDDRKFLATTDSKTYTSLLAKVF